MKTIVSFVVIIPMLIVGIFIPKQEANIFKDQDTIACQGIIINCFLLRDGNYIIRNQKEYHDSFYPDCGKYQLPFIDFNQYTLLGAQTSAGGCEAPEKDYFITKDNQDRSYQFILNIKENGGCENIFWITIWCVIPKIEDSAIVNFKINEKFKY